MLWATTGAAARRPTQKYDARRSFSPACVYLPRPAQCLTESANLKPLRNRRANKQRTGGTASYVRRKRHNQQLFRLASLLLAPMMAMVVMVRVVQFCCGSFSCGRKRGCSSTSTLSTSAALTLIRIFWKGAEDQRRTRPTSSLRQWRFDGGQSGQRVHLPSNLTAGRGEPSRARSDSDERTEEAGRALVSHRPEVAVSVILFLFKSPLLASAGTDHVL